MTAHSHQEVDAWLRSVAEEVEIRVAGLTEGAQAGRLNGSDFAVMLPGYDGPSATRFAGEIARVLADLRLTRADGMPSRWAFSLTGYDQGDEAGKVMGVLDYGLMRAESAGHGEVEYLPGDDSVRSRAGVSEGAWRVLLQEALASDGIKLTVQQVHYENDAGVSVARADAFLLLRDGQEWLAGSLFIPAATRLNMSVECDLRAIDLAIAWLESLQGELVLRISLASLAQARFWPALRERLDRLEATPHIARRLVLEIDAYGLIAHAEQVKQFCLAARAAEIRVGVRRLDAEPAALPKLHSVAIDYVRLTGPLIESLSEGVGGLELLRAVCSTARRLRLRVFADTPATEADAISLRKHNVIVMQR